MLDLLVREDGGIRLICGRGTDFGPSPRFTDTPPPRALYAMTMLGLAQAFAALAGRLADQHAAYQGQWRLGIRIDRLRGVVPMDKLTSPGNPPGHPYTRDEYERITSATTEELVNAPHAITERLLAPPCFEGSASPRYIYPEPRPSGFVDRQPGAGLHGTACDLGDTVTAADGQLSAPRGERMRLCLAQQRRYEDPGRRIPR